MRSSSGQITVVVMTLFHWQSVLGFGFRSVCIIRSILQSSKRILRSNEISLMHNGLVDTELDLTFSMQVGASVLSYTVLLVIVETA